MVQINIIVCFSVDVSKTNIYNINCKEVNTLYKLIKKVGKNNMRGKQIMSNKQLNSYLEAIKIIVKNSADKENTIKAIEQLQKKLKE